MTASELNRIIGCTPALRFPRKGNPDTSLALYLVEFRTGKDEWGEKSGNVLSIEMAGNLLLNAPPMWFRMSIHIARIDYGD